MVSEDGRHATVAGARLRHIAVLEKLSDGVLDEVAGCFATEHVSDGPHMVCPGLIDTAMADRSTGGPESALEQFIMSLTPMRRRGTAAEVAEAVVWLCSDAASYVTGHSMVVDGGLMTI